MPVTMQQVIVQLDREEPDYAQAARLGPDALPHLATLIQGPDLGLAAKAASLAGVLDAAGSAAVLAIAVRHREPVVRVAAAAAAQRLHVIPPALADGLLADPDPGVREWALHAVAARPGAGMRARVEQIMRADPDAGLRERARGVAARLPQ